MSDGNGIGEAKRKVWEAFGGVMLIEVGKRKDGQPRFVLATQVITVMSKAEAKRVEKAQPSLKFKERTTDSGGPDGR